MVNVLMCLFVMMLYVIVFPLLLLAFIVTYVVDRVFSFIHRLIE